MSLLMHYPVSIDNLNVNIPDIDINSLIDAQNSDKELKFLLNKQKDKKPKKYFLSQLITSANLKIRCESSLNDKFRIYRVYHDVLTAEYLENC